MAIQWLEEVRRAEENAEKIRLDAAEQGRDIIKSVEEASVGQERQAATDMRGEYQRRMADKRQEIEAALNARAGGSRQAFDALCEQARARIPAAARIVAERILSHGDR